MRFESARTGARARRAAQALAAWMLLSAAPAAAQQSGTVQGRVVTAEGSTPLAGVYVAVDGSSHGVITEENGTYRMTRVGAGDVVLIARYLGRRVGRLEVRVPSGGTAEADFRLAVEAVPVTELVVSAAREAQRQAETPAAIEVVSGAALRDARPAHPSEVMNRVPASRAARDT